MRYFFWMAALALCPASVAWAQPFLQVDFQNNQGVAGAAQLQPGFSAMSGSATMASDSAVFSTSKGNITVSWANSGVNNGGYFNRNGYVNGGGITTAALLNDFVYDNAGGPLRFTIAGLRPNHPYEISWYASDFIGPSFSFDQETQFAATPLSDTFGSIVSVSYDSATSITADAQARATGIWSAPDGTLDITATGLTSQFNRVNGFQISETPEPATIAIWTVLGLGVAAFGLWRGRRG